MTEPTITVMKTPSYSEIANNFRLWMEYADPSGLDTEAAFNAKSEQQKIEFLVACFGPEQDADHLADPK